MHDASDAEDARREPIEQHRLVVGEPEMLQRDVHVRERHRERARRRAARRDTCAPAPAPSSRSAATPVANVTRTNAPGASRTRSRSARDRIEHGAGRARQRAAVERDRVGRRSSAAEEPRAIGFPLDRAAERGRRRRARGTPRRGGSSADRGRRLNSRPALCASYSVSMNSLPNAGCARSSSGRASTISA